MMTHVVDWKDDGTANINASAVAELGMNNCTMPDIKRMSYNLKAITAKRDAEGNKVKDENGNVVMVDLENPVLATIIEFVDNTKVIAKNCLNAKVDLETRTLEDGTVVKLATEDAKERGLVYALVKRLKGTVDGKGNVVEGGEDDEGDEGGEGDDFGHWLRMTVASAFDHNYEKAVSVYMETDAMKARREARREIRVAATIAHAKAKWEQAERRASQRANKLRLMAKVESEKAGRQS